ncbi:hypothetical protein CFOL_v3_03324, partial [Cephalotus follicularis]
AHVCNEGICLKQTFILVKDLDIWIILGQLFLKIVKPFKVNNDGITTKLLKRKTLFTFNEQTITKDINLLTQLNYATIKKEILAIVLCIKKFQSDLLNQNFLIRVDCVAVSSILTKNVNNLASKQFFARWQGILSSFDFSIQHISCDTNSLPDYLTHEFLQGT